MRGRRIGLIACALVGFGALGGALAADHGDGPLELDVVQSLVEAPPYPAAAVEIDAGLRQPPEPVLPAGQILMVLESARDAGPSGDDLPMMGTFVDNGDPFGEPGDEAAVDMRFIQGSPPEPVYPSISRHEWLARFPGRPASIPVWELASWSPSRSGEEFQFFEVDVVLYNGAGVEVGRLRLQILLEVGPGQDLAIANPSITAPVPTGPGAELRLVFELEQGAGGVDPAEPIYSLTVTTVPIPIPALGPRYGPVLLGLLLLAAALGALGATRRRSSRLA